MTDHVTFMTQYATLMEGWLNAAREKNDILAVKKYEKRLDSLRGLISEVEHLRRVTTPVPTSYGDLSDLPPELLKELSAVKVDELEQQLYSIIKAGPEVDLDSILIELYRRFSIIQTRRFLQNKLYRMTQKEVIFSVTSRKGVYTAIKPEEGNFSEQVAAKAAQHSSEKSQTSFATDFEDDVPF